MKLALALLIAADAFGYSVLTHQAIVDAAWTTQVVPALRERFPAITDDQLLAAHAHAYGGSIVQDMGYYPFSNRLFSDLVHYVRSGDFVENLIAEAATPEEYAFALGALAHYAADNHGHPATNRAVALLYPKKRKEFGESITYAEYPGGHVAAEFSFDVLQAARGRYAAESYRDFIGFEVSEQLLERAFLRTYGLDLESLFLNLDLAIGTYRWAVSGLIPEMTDVALASHLKDFDATRRFRLDRRGYEQRFGRNYRRPGWFARFLALLLRIVPKVGFLRPLRFRTVTPEVEKLFLASFDETVTVYSNLLKTARSGSLDLRNTNLDDGRASNPGEYPYTDRAYAALARQLADLPAGSVPHSLRSQVSEWFGSHPNRGKIKRSDWRKTIAALQKLHVTRNSDSEHIQRSH